MAANLLRRFIFLGNIFYSSNYSVDFISQREHVAKFIFEIFKLNDSEEVKKFYIDFLKKIGVNYYDKYPDVFYKAFQVENQFFKNLKSSKDQELFLNFLIDAVILPDEIFYYLNFLFSEILTSIDEYLDPIMMNPQEFETKDQIEKYLKNIVEMTFINLTDFVEWDGKTANKPLKIVEISNSEMENNYKPFSEAISFVAEKLSERMSGFVKNYSKFF
jgi:hypothetical protein